MFRSHAGHTMRDARWGGSLPAAAMVAALAALLAPQPTAAQSGFSVTPWAGAYVPTSNDIEGVDADIERNNSFVGGARLTGWGRSPFGLELTGGYAPARVRVAGETINEDRDTQVFVGGLKLMLGLSPATSRLGVYIGAGPAVIRRGRDIVDEDESVTDFAGVAGAGLRLPLSESLGVRIDVEDYFYRGEFGGSDEFQHDLVLSAGLAIGW